MRLFVPLATVLATVRVGAAAPGVFFVLGGQTRPHMAVSGPTHMVKTVHHVMLMDNGGHPMKPIVADSKTAGSTPQAVVVAPPAARRDGLAISASAPPAVRIPHLYQYQLPRYGRVPGFNYPNQFQQLPTYLNPTFAQPGGGANSYEMQGLKDLAARFLDPVDFKAISLRQEMMDRHKEMIEQQKREARQQEMLQRQIEAAEIQQDFDKMDQMLAQISEQPPASPAQLESDPHAPATEQQQPQHQEVQQPQEEPHPQGVDHPQEVQQEVQEQQQAHQHEHIRHHQLQQPHHHHHHHQEQKQPDVQPEEKPQHAEVAQDHMDHRTARKAQHQFSSSVDHQPQLQAIAGHPEQLAARFQQYHQQQHYPQQYEQYHEGAPAENLRQREVRHHDRGSQVASSHSEAIWRNRQGQQRHVVDHHVADGLHVIHDGEAPRHQPVQVSNQQRNDQQTNETQQKRNTIKEQVAASEVHETILKGKRRLTARLRLKERVPSSAAAMFWI